MTRRQAVAWLILVTFVWGASFTLTKHALTQVSPLMLMGARFAAATILVARAARGIGWPEIRAGAVLGTLFWVGFAFQTTGLGLTTASRSAFITSLSSTLTPVVAFAALRTVPSKLVAWAIVLATLGTYLLTAPESAGGVNVGDLLTLGCAVVFAGHIVAASHYPRRFDPVRLLAVQLGVTALLSFATAPLLETPRFAPGPAVGAILLVLALSGLWSFYMQLRAQREVTSAEAALVFMLEPVFATIISFLVLGERFSPIQWVGGTCILAALATSVLGDRAAIKLPV